MKKLLPIIGLLLLVSCGQSLDTTVHTDDGGEDITTETNHNRLEDIQDCLNGDRDACKRAVNEGFTNAPVFFEDLAEADSINVEGVTYNFFRTNETEAIFRWTKRYNNYNGGTNHMDIIVDIAISDDYSVNIVPKYKWHWQTNWTLLADILQPGTDTTFLSKFTFLPESNLEWKSHDSSSIHIETIGNVSIH